MDKGVPPAGSGCQGFAPQPPSASSQSGIPNAALFALGFAMFLGGSALFGAGFDFIDAHIHWPTWALMPVLAAAALVMASLIGVGLALMLGATASAIEAATAGETRSGSTEGESAAREAGDAHA